MEISMNWCGWCWKQKVKKKRTLFWIRIGTFKLRFTQWKSEILKEIRNYRMSLPKTMCKHWKHLKSYQVNKSGKTVLIVPKMASNIRKKPDTIKTVIAQCKSQRTKWQHLVFRQNAANALKKPKDAIFFLRSTENNQNNLLILPKLKKYKNIQWHLDQKIKELREQSV